LPVRRTSRVLRLPVRPAVCGRAPRHAKAELRRARRGLCRSGQDADSRQQAGCAASRRNEVNDDCVYGGGAVQGSGDAHHVLCAPECQSVAEHSHFQRAACCGGGGIARGGVQARWQLHQVVGQPIAMRGQLLLAFAAEHARHARVAVEHYRGDTGARIVERELQLLWDVLEDLIL
jgi:hypothetical protein